MAEVCISRTGGWRCFAFGGGFLWPNQQCQSTEGSIRVPRIMLKYAV